MINKHGLSHKSMVKWTIINFLCTHCCIPLRYKIAHENYNTATQSILVARAIQLLDFIVNIFSLLPFMIWENLERCKRELKPKYML